MAINSYLPVITQSVNGLLLKSKEIERLSGFKNKNKNPKNYILPTRLSLLGHRQAESEEMEKNYSILMVTKREQKWLYLNLTK